MSNENLPEIVKLRDRINKKIECIEKEEGKKGNKVEVEKYLLPPSDYQIFLKEFERMKKAGEIPKDCKPNIGLPIEEDERIKELTIVYSTRHLEDRTKPYVKKPYHHYYPYWH